MKLNTLTSIFSIALFAIFFVSCENEPLEGFDFENNIIVDPISNNDSVTPVEGENIEVEASTGDYWPTQVGYVWNFNTTTYGNTISEISGTTVFGDETYFEYDNFMGQDSFYIRKDGSNYYVAQDISGSNVNGYTVAAPVIKVLLLKDNLEVGETYTQNINYTVSYTPDPGYPDFPDQNVNTTYVTEMIERDIAYEVGGVEYQNVIHIELETIFSGNVVATSHYYFSKDIGPINFTQTTGNDAFLTSYEF